MMKNANEILNIISNIKKLYKYINILYNIIYYINITWYKKENITLSLIYCPI